MLSADAGALLPLLTEVPPRDPFADAKQTLSSWDNCMAKDYCKSV